MIKYIEKCKFCTQIPFLKFFFDLAYDSDFLYRRETESPIVTKLLSLFHLKSQLSLTASNELRCKLITYLRNICFHSKNVTF